MSEPELLREIAIVLFNEKKLSLGRASYLAGMNLLEFRRELASRRIPVGYDISEFKEDLKTLEDRAEVKVRSPFFQLFSVQPQM